ncbi:DUF2188 domain-containing protein [Lacticaseibacillus daqingensis]|uniref:DUF2188 domain-containing protein n=1 Tax=Lacticaseibacillus daqingensis TaxID=2486014 RepID=UPI000F77F097|nr:DUF2188 domain-containing protein [Lacticaseibacillus daqingensis]
MSWDLTDYPVSMKHLPALTRKKAIDIANALLAAGYPDERAIPIATSQAEKWVQAATASEKRALRRAPAPTKHDAHAQATRRERQLHDAVTEVRPHAAGWAVVARGAKRNTETFARKTDAITRAKAIARHKDAAVAIYRKDETLQRTVKPRPV